MQAAVTSKKLSTASSFVEKKVDGETLHNGACGLKAIKQQLLFQKLINNQPMSVEVNDQGGSQVVNVQLSMYSSLSKEEDKRIYKVWPCTLLCAVQLLNHCRRIRVSAAARSAWPGNSIPKFKNNEEESKIG